MNLKKKHLLFLVFLIIFLTAGSHYYSSIIKMEEELEEELKIWKNQREELLELEEKKNKGKEELNKKQEVLNVIQELEKQLVTLEELNDFVKKFEEVRKKYRGVNKVSYEVLDEENKLSINLSFLDSYNNIRKFLYEVEKTFFFLEISYLKIEKGERLVKGNFNIQVYFRSIKDEK